MRQLPKSLKTQAPISALFTRKQFEHAPLQLLLCAMGSEIERNAHPGSLCYASDNIWHCDPERIEDHGDYKQIAIRPSTLSQGARPLEDTEDFVDRVEREATWLSFSADGRAEK